MLNLLGHHFLNPIWSFTKKNTQLFSRFKAFYNNLQSRPQRTFYIFERVESLFFSLVFNYATYFGEFAPSWNRSNSSGRAIIRIQEWVLNCNSQVVWAADALERIPLLFIRKPRFPFSQAALCESAVDSSRSRADTDRPISQWNSFIPLRLAQFREVPSAPNVL